MATFKCTVCEKIIDKNIEKCCSSGAVPCKEKEVFHCGKPMMEIID